MKTINNTLLFGLLLILTILPGCMPDSMTKFKKDSPKPAAKVSSGVVVTDSSGNAVDPSTITYPTTFYYRKEKTAFTNWYLKVGTTYKADHLNYIVDGTMATLSQKSLIFLRCELDVDVTDGNLQNDTLPTGMELDSTECLMKGEPTAVYTSSAVATIGQPLPYKIRMYFKNAKNYAVGTTGAITCSTTECYIKSTTINIGSYLDPVDLTMTQNDKLGILGSNFTTDVTAFIVNDNSMLTRNDYVTSYKGSMGLIQILNSTKSLIYLQRGIPLTVASISGFTVGELAGTYDTISVTSTAGLTTVGTEITTDGGYKGRISFVSGTNLYVIRNASSPATLGTNITVPVARAINVGSSNLVANPVVGTVLGIDATNKVVRVTQPPTYPGAFNITTNSNITGYQSSSLTTITSIDANDGFRDSVKIDNDTQFYSQEAQAKATTQYYKVGTAIDTIQPIVSSNATLLNTNGVTYSISPALPTGLSFDTTTGYITGTFQSEQEPTEFIIRAANPLTYVETTIKLAAIYEPKDLAYTKNMVIPVSNANTYPNSVFYEGENIFQPIDTAVGVSIQGSIKRKFTDSTKSMLEIRTRNGLFNPGASIDAGRAFVAEKAFISATADVYKYNLVLYLTAAATMTDFNVSTATTSYYVTTGSGAKARIIYKDAARRALYLQFLTPDTSSIKYFSEGDTITESSTAGTGVVEYLESEAYKLKLTGLTVDLDTDGYTIGTDVTSTDGTSKVGGYIYNYDNTNSYIYVDNVSKTPGVVDQYNVVTTQYPEFKKLQTIKNSERYSATAVTINEVTHDNIIFANRGENFKMHATVSQGSNLDYSITPALPTGLSLNSATGLISGVPTTLTNKKSYVVSASNLLGTVSFKFELEVRDYFKFAESSTTSTSLILHKVGDTQNARECKINATDIKNASGNLDIRCFLDGEEQDLNEQNLKFEPLVGSGVCEYIQYTPVSYQQFPTNPISDDKDAGSYFKHYTTGCNQDQAPAVPGNPSWWPGTCTGSTDPTYNTSKVVTDAECTGTGGTWTAAPASKIVTTKPTTTMKAYCPANYTGWLDSKYPNCDEDSFTVYTHNTTLDTTTGKCNRSSQTKELIKCGGNISACITGPIKDVLDDTAIKKGFRGLIYTVASGTTSTGIINHKSPKNAGETTNLRVANSTQGNACTSTNSDTTDWINVVNNLTAVANNYGANSQAVRKAALDTAPFVNGNPVYIINCLDAAYDIKARIRLYVRDWDRSFKITDNIDSDTPTSGTCSDKTKLTQATCLAPRIWTPKLNTGNAVDSFGKYYNNYEDWDDDYYSSLNILYDTTDYPAVDYKGGTCSDATKTNNYECLAGAGSCSNATYTGKFYCEIAGYIWTSTNTWTPAATSCGVPSGTNPSYYAFPGDEL